MVSTNYGNMYSAYSTYLNTKNQKTGANNSESCRSLANALLNDMVFASSGSNNSLFVPNVNRGLVTAAYNMAYDTVDLNSQSTSKGSFTDQLNSEAKKNASNIGRTGSAEGKVSGIGYASAVQTKKSGYIEDSMKKYPQYADDWKKEIEAGYKLQNTYPPSKSKDEMSRDEYKTYISGIIDRIPQDISRSTTESSIIISDDTFDVMKDDPDYEAYVLGGIKEIFTFRNPWMVGSDVKRYEIIRFGSRMENFSGSSWGDMTSTFAGKSGAQSYFDKLSKGSFWHNDPESKRLQKQSEQRMYNRRFQRKRQTIKTEEERAMQKKVITAGKNPHLFTRLLCAENTSKANTDNVNSMNAFFTARQSFTSGLLI